MSIVTQGLGDQGAIITQGYGAGIFEKIGTIVVKLAMTGKRAVIEFVGKRSEIDFTGKRANITFTKVDC